MAEIDLAKQKVFDLTLSTVLNINSNQELQHLGIKSLSASAKIYIRTDGTDAAVGNNECILIDPAVNILGYDDIYSKSSFKKISVISNENAQVVLYNLF